MKSKIMGLLAVGLLAGPMVACAESVSATLSNVAVGSDSYNVTFLHDTSGAISFSPAYIYFSTASDAEAATGAVLAAVQANNLNLDLLGNGRSAFVVPFASTATSWTFYSGANADPLRGTGVFGPTTTSASGAIVPFATFSLISMDPTQLLSDLIGQVLDLNTDAGIGNALDSKLQNGLDALDRAQAGDAAAASGILYAFVQSVEAQRGKKLTDQQADGLVASAQAIIDALGRP